MGRNTVIVLLAIAVLIFAWFWTHSRYLPNDSIRAVVAGIKPSDVSSVTLDTFGVKEIRDPRVISLLVEGLQEARYRRGSYPIGDQVNSITLRLRKGKKIGPLPFGYHAESAFSPKFAEGLRAVGIGVIPEDQDVPLPVR